MGPNAHLCIDIWRVGLLLLDLYLLVPRVIVETTQVCVVVVVGIYILLGEFRGSSGFRSLSSTLVSVDPNYLHRGVRNQHYHDPHQQLISPQYPPLHHLCCDSIDKCRVVHRQLFSTWSPDPQLGGLGGSEPGRQLDQNMKYAQETKEEHS